MKRTFFLLAVLLFWHVSFGHLAGIRGSSIIMPLSLQYSHSGFQYSHTGIKEFPDTLLNSAHFQDSVHLQEIEILAPGKTSLAALRITRPDSIAMDAGITSDLAELLSRNTPVFIKHYGPGSIATASFRGTAASHTQVLWNGMKLNSPALGYTDLSLLPLFFTDEIVLLHGGSSLAGSSGALGGSIHLDNTPDWGKKTSFSGLVETGSFGTRKLMGKFQLGVSRFNSVTRIFFDTSENNYPFFNTGVLPNHRDTLRNADYIKRALLQEFNFHTSEHFISALRFWFQASERNLPQLMSYEGKPRTEFQHDNQKRIQYQGKVYSGKYNIQFFTGLNNSRMQYFRQTSPDTYVMDDAVSIENSWYNQMEFSGNISPALTIKGVVDANLDWISTEDRAKMFYAKKERKEAGLLLHLQYHPTAGIDFYLLSRAEYYDRKMIPLIPASGIEWQLHPKWPLYLKANVAYNFHKPGLNDLYWIPGGNPSLLPEKGKSGEISLSTKNKRARSSFTQEMTFFLSEINNWIIWQPSAVGAWYWEATNLKNALTQGLEYNFNLSYKVRNWRYFAGGNYAWTRAVDRDAVSSADLSRGKQLIYIPKHTYNLHLTVSWSDWIVTGDNSFTGKRYTQSSHQVSYFESVLNPFWVTNLSLQKNIRHEDFQVSIKFKVENLFDNAYQQILWRPMPGRSCSLIIAASFVK